MSSSGTSVQVIVRLRPMNDFETKQGTLPVITASGQEKTITVIKGQGPRQVRSSFTFDNVFSAFSSQKEIFDQTLKPVISDVMQGYESTVFAYGQTGTGKTYTMEGDLSSSEQHGIIPRAAQAIFESLKKPDFTSYSISCSYLEIYNEDLGDLLVDDLQISLGKGIKLEIMESKEGTFCRGLTEKSVESAEDVLALMLQAQQYRKVGETKMNKNSSRSHCIFTIRVQAKRTLMDSTVLDINGKLHMVDLAGSECAKTAALDKNIGPESVARERERMNINRSLLTLGRVIKTLREQSDSKKSQQNVRIPYRDSKLTRILQESLGGRCKTLIIATLSPSITAIEESMSTLTYAQTAIGIVNKPISSSYLSIIPTGFGNSNTNNESSVEYATAAESWIEMECRLQYMQAQVDEAQAALARKHLQQQEFVDKIERLEEEKLDLQRQHFNITQTLNRTTAELLKEKEEKELLAARLHDTELTLNKTEAILRATQQTEINLTSEATALLNTLRESIVDGDILHHLLREAREAEQKTKTATKVFQASVATNLDDVGSCLTQLTQRVKEYNIIMANAVISHTIDEHKSLVESIAMIESVEETAHHLMQQLRSHMIDDEGLSPVITKLCTSINDSIEAVRRDFVDGESILSNGLSEIIESIEQHSATLTNMNDSFLSSSSSISEQLQQAIKGVRDRYTSIVTNASDSIKALRCFNESTRSDLAALVSDWKASCDMALSDVESKASDQSTHLAALVGRFVKDWQHHDDMYKYLANQQIFMSKYGDIHTQTLTSLANRLSQQQEAFNQESRRQQTMRDEFMKSVMDGVHAVVKSHVDKVASEHLQFISSIDTRNTDLIDTSSKLQSGSTYILSNINETNVALSRALQSAVQSDRDMRDVAEESRLCLESIRDSSHRGQDETLHHTDKARRLLDDLNNQDNTLVRTMDSMLSESKNCSDDAVSQLLNRSAYNLSQLTQAGTDLYDYATQVLAGGTKISMQAVQSRRPAVSAGLRDNLDRAVSTAMRTEQTVQSIVKTMATVCDEVDRDIESKMNTFNSVKVPQDRTIMEDHKTFLLQKINDSESVSSSLVKTSSSGLHSTMGHVSDFANHVVGVDKTASSMDERKKIVYSEKLSATHVEDSTCDEFVSVPIRPLASCIKDDCRVADENLSRSFSSSSRSSDSSESFAPVNIRGSSPLRERSINNVLADINSFMKTSASIIPSSRRMGPFPYQPTSKCELSHTVRANLPGSPMGNIGKKRGLSTPNSNTVKRNKA